MRRAAAFAFVASSFALGCAPGARNETTYAAQVPSEVRASFELFSHRCSKCHALARALESGISDDEQWVRYVRRMRLQPMSGISASDEIEILPFLRHYAQRERERRATAAQPPPPLTDASTVQSEPLAVGPDR